ncbi:type II toxin-antitoxin system RelE/ParE family toxin [Nitrospira sp. M1]
MSSRNKYTLSLTQEAESDFINILVYTAQEWGGEKLQEYDASICHALDVIKDNPFLGYRHPLLTEEHRCFTVRKHVLVYQIKNSHIYVLRILHQRMNFPSHL